MEKKRNTVLQALVIVPVCAAALIYLLAPVFNVPLFGIEKGFDTVSQMWTLGRYMEMTTFLLPLIGGIGATLCTLSRQVGPHILALAFSMLPVMFFVHYIHIMAKAMGGNLSGVAALFSWGIWASLLLSLVAFVAASIVVYKELKKK